MAATGETSRSDVFFNLRTFLTLAIPSAAGISVGKQLKHRAHNTSPRDLSHGRNHKSGSV